MGRFDIEFVCLPPNATHLLQPHDVAFYAPLKRAWRHILEQWKLRQRQHETNVPKADFPLLLRKPRDEISVTSAQTIISGFCATGIVAHNPLAVMAKIPGVNNNDESVVSDVVIDMLTIIRRGSESSRPPTI